MIRSMLIPIWVILRVFLATDSGFFSVLRKSTQKEVVKEVSALSALLYAAAIKPSIKVTATVMARPLFSAISGNNRSDFGAPSISGKAIL